MKKVTKKKVEKEEIVSAGVVGAPTTATEVPAVKCCRECPKIDRLTIGFPSEDLNKLVEKINEIIDKTNGSL